MRNSVIGDNLFVRALQGQPARIIGNPDAPHTFTYINDFARALIPPRQFVNLVHEHLGGTSRHTTVPRCIIRLLGTIKPGMRALNEMLHQHKNPWIVNHSQYEAAFGATPTPHPDGIRATLAWYKTFATSHRR